MPKILFLPDECHVDVRLKDTVLKASLKAKIPHLHVCRGRARCSTCRIIVEEGLENCSPRTDRESKLANRLHFGPEVRLACQTKVTGNIKVRRPVLDKIDMQITNQLRRKGDMRHYGEEKRIGILFCDIIGYTPFAESLPAYDVVHVLNRYYFQMNQVIERNGGEISDFIGDGLLALFGTNNTNNCAINAVKAGLEMNKAMKELNPYLQSMYGKTFEIRIGVHYGNVVIGTFGNSKLAKISAIGDAVNFASRIEEANKKTNTKFLISEETYSAVRDQITIGKDFSMEIRGKKGEYKLYEVLGIN
ncbi:adenylate/guanylate cyclase domain-containing protein [Fulvivirgaceae bacterium BMA10]|uniref:Adenylate/guanylate cyclase domain-containing protein n=1 Tax=Splendidivirga corallicola TaxID=3051826 RepID=A0ABT8KXL9_9BACT|nr:adenylate/guanylate cyclase domain-containing protein [Fulvivirgaceae bacterium BMA10]